MSIFHVNIFLLIGFLSQLRAPTSFIVGSSEDKSAAVSTPSSVVSDTTIDFIGRMIFLHATL